MKRNVSALAERSYDVAVIGAGIHGATIAAAAAECGLSVVLLDKGDFCGATSANSLKILHGGLRYLQHLDIRRIRDSIASRRWMMANFPEITRPLQCILLTSGRGFRSRPGMALGLAVNDLFSWFRNRGVAEANHLGKGRTLPLAVCEKIIPGLKKGKWTGGALWYDALAVNTERIVMSLVHGLWQRGGRAANYVEVQGILQENGKVTGLSCYDRETHCSHKIDAQIVVNATGAGLEQFGIDQVPDQVVSGWSKAVNLILDRNLFGEYAVGLEGTSTFTDKDALVQKGKRLFFFVPWRGKTMVGTVYSHVASVSRDPELSSQEIQSILSEINQIYPHVQLQASDVCNYHVGFVPCMESDDQGPFDVQLDKRELVLDHGEKGGLKNVYSIKTVKFTTAYTLCRIFLECLHDKGMLSVDLWKRLKQSELRLFPVQDDWQKLPAWLVYRWGTAGQAIGEKLSADALAADEANDQVTLEEIRYGVEEEMALHLEDFLFRRSGIATVGLPDRALQESVCQEMGRLLGWDEKTCQEELAHVQRHFASLI